MKLVLFLAAFCIIITVRLELRGFNPLFYLRIVGKTSNKKSQSTGVGIKQSTEDHFQLILTPRSTRIFRANLSLCNLASF